MLGSQGQSFTAEIVKSQEDKLIYLIYLMLYRVSDGAGWPQEARLSRGDTTKTLAHVILKSS